MEKEKYTCTVIKTNLLPTVKLDYGRAMYDDEWDRNSRVR